MFKYLFCVVFLILNLGLATAQVSINESIEKLEKEEQDLFARQKKIEEELENLRLSKIREDLHKVGLPTVKAGLDNQIVEHGAMILSYNEKYEQANWSAHIVVPAVNKGNLSRTNNFRIDSLVKTGSAVKEDYWNSGYDRGHLAPSADFRWSARAISESYVYSNMAPQRPEFNRESWAALESFIRQNVWVSGEQLYVVTGPVFTDSMATLTQGPNVIAIPKYFYKVVLDITGEEKKAIAFIMPNERCKNPQVTYAVSIDEVEKQTGLDFFNQLEDGLEAQLEGNFDFGKWEGLKEGEVSNQVPLTLKQRPPNSLNSLDAYLFLNKKGCVCGTVVSTHKSKSGSVFFNFDAKFPDHNFSGSIWGSNLQNFSYAPEIELLGKRLCITGKITEHKEKPTMTVEDEHQIMFIDENGEEISE